MKRTRSRLSHLLTDVTAVGMFATRMAILGSMAVASRLAGRVIRPAALPNETMLPDLEHNAGPKRR